jgi:heme exporter protein A
MLEVRDLIIWRGENLLLDEVSFAVDAGSILQIQGTNGAGKTTLLRALIGLAEVDDGEVLWKGRPSSSLRQEMQSALIYLGHKAGISAGLSPLENILMLCPELSLDSRDLVYAVLTELSIGNQMDLPSAALSAGQQRRVSLARLRLQRAELWILDEPLTSLDANGREWVRMQIINHVVRGGAVIMTTHQPLIFSEIQVETLTLGTHS